MNNRRYLINVLIIYVAIYAVSWLILPRYFPNYFSGQRKQPSPVQIAQNAEGLRDQAAKAEQEARNTQLSLSDRSKKWDDALHAYRDLERVGKNTDVAIDALFQQARVFEQRALSDVKDTGDYDQAERIYKDLERHHPRDRATVNLDGKSTQVVAGELARQKLETVLMARDQRQRGRFLYQVMDFFVALTFRIPGFSYWFALLLITIIVKGLLYPTTKRQFKSMADMQRIAPKLKELQEKYKGRPADEINRKVMALYKEEGVNPVAGCLPVALQMAVLIPLYQMIRMYEYQFRHGYFFWIGSGLSHQYPLWIATSLAVPDVVLLVLYCISMALTSRLQPPAADPQQAQMQKMMTYVMPVMFGYFTWNFAWPSAFTFYWLCLNMISTAQQWRILKAVGSANPSRPPQASVLPPDRGAPGGGSNGGNGRSNGGNGRNGARPVKPSGGKPSGAKKSARR